MSLDYWRLIQTSAKSAFQSRKLNGFPEPESRARRVGPDLCDPGGRHQCVGDRGRAALLTQGGPFSTMTLSPRPLSSIAIASASSSVSSSTSMRSPSSKCSTMANVPALEGMDMQCGIKWTCVSLRHSSPLTVDSLSAGENWPPWPRERLESGRALVSAGLGHDVHREQIYNSPRLAQLAFTSGIVNGASQVAKSLYSSDGVFDFHSCNPYDAPVTFGRIAHIS